MPLHTCLARDSLRWARCVFLNPNSAAVISNVGFALCLAPYLDSRKAIYLALSIIPALAVVFTFSKLGLVTFGILVMLAFLHGFRTHARQVVIAVSVIAIVGFAFVYTWLPQLEDSQMARLHAIGKLLGANIDADISTGRTVVWHAAIGQIIDQGVVAGAGLGTMRAVEGGIFHAGAWQGVHNLWLVILGESGLIPTLVFGALVIALFGRVLTMTQRNFFALAYLVIFLLDTFVTHHILETRYHAYIMGLAIGRLFLRPSY